ncbi:hypothetical protein MCNF_00110 [Mycolicibacterium confluentis]|uniref:Uncharacterized protein n=1 Tax=Mycolicibacterium confluentis TaxID=28047 RepID=A0A7I7XQA1_9MYCO|nr:hypothetical protein MCNF_00110 [Mycolicibacterium confluentis]
MDLVTQRRIVEENCYRTGVCTHEATVRAGGIATPLRHTELWIDAELWTARCAFAENRIPQL